MDMTVSTLNVKLSPAPSELAAGGRINGDTTSQTTIPITEATIQRMIARRRWFGSAGGVALPAFPSILGSDMLPPLIVCYCYRSSHIPGGGHRPGKPIGRFAVITTRDIAVPDVGM